MALQAPQQPSSERSGPCRFQRTPPGLCTPLLPQAGCPALLPKDSPHTRQRTGPRPRLSRLTTAPDPDTCPVTDVLPRCDTRTTSEVLVVTSQLNEGEKGEEERQLENCWARDTVPFACLCRARGTVPLACLCHQPAPPLEEPPAGAFEPLLTTDELFPPLVSFRAAVTLPNSDGKVPGLRQKRQKQHLLQMSQSMGCYP